MISALISALALPLDQPNLLWYDKPATQWVEALPLGNGRTGAMVFGGASEERYQLNDGTLWSGEPKEWNTAGAAESLPKLREAVFGEKWGEVDRIAQKLQGSYTQSYMPLGDLKIAYQGLKETKSYRRSLDISQGIASVSFESNGVKYTREAFISHPNQVMVIRLTSSQQGKLNFTAKLSSLLQHKTSAFRRNTLEMTGKAPIEVRPNYLSHPDPVKYSDKQGTRFAVKIQAVTQRGKVTCSQDALSVNDADEVILLLSTATSFNGFQKSPSRQGKNERKLTEEAIWEAEKKSYEQLLDTHREDFQKLFGRVDLQLEANSRKLPTNERLAAYKANPDPDLAALVFQYGRYLLISSSRPGSQPANLQGLWNDMVRPPWSSNYTLNINAEMNYWLAETCNLSECHEPLLKMTEELAVTGAKTAKVHYGAKGWVAHHNSDIWRLSSPVGELTGDPVWANWSMAAPWLCQHLWEHYSFTRDFTYLKSVYPTMKGAAEFCLDWLIEDQRNNAPKDAFGKPYLVTVPSTSPETKYIAPDGKRVAVGVASAMDLAMIRELFRNCIAAAKILGTDKDFSTKLETASARLLPFQIGKRGQLQEWGDDYLEEDVNHRHLSHLYGAYPSDVINESTPKLLKAVRTALELRGDDATGWGMAWRLCLWARLKEPTRCTGMINRLLNPVDMVKGTWSGGGIYPNLFDAHPPFQIDGNFGYSAGVAEMLVQSHQGFIEILPCLPAEWSTGSVRGLRCRGGFSVDIAWKDRKIVSGRIVSHLGGELKIKFPGGALRTTKTKRGEVISLLGPK